MRHFKLTIAYEGTDFHGWQMQSNKPTVQGEIVNVLERVTQERVFLRRGTNGRRRTCARPGSQLQNSIGAVGRGIPARAKRAAAPDDSHCGGGRGRAGLSCALVGATQNLPLSLVSRKSRAAIALALRLALSVSAR